VTGIVSGTVRGNGSYPTKEESEKEVPKKPLRRPKGFSSPLSEDFGQDAERRGKAWQGNRSVKTVC